jgi:5-methylcytosine-specific restriction endonuclease McrA
VSVPSPEFQLNFLTKLQRLFAEGDFTATYKFALLISIADIAVQHGQDNNAPLTIDHRSIGKKFIELYWQQTAPFKQHSLLSQNLGIQAAVVSKIANFRQSNKSISAALSSKLLITAVTSTVVAQPIKYMQNLGGVTEEFLFKRGDGHITILPGIAYCLRRFQPLVQQLSRTHWIEHIKGNKQNIDLIGQDNKLEEFLFETPRKSLQAIGLGLRKISTKCFYCGHTVTDVDVDHFIPHSLYPRDLAHNFVLADPKCNRSKSDTLAARSHLQRWLDFIETNKDNLSEIGAEAGILVDFKSMNYVALWGYQNALAGGSQAWIRSKFYEPVEASYLNYWADLQA